MPRPHLILASLLLAVLVGCGGVGPPAGPQLLAVTPLAGPPGSPLTVTGLADDTDAAALEAWLGDEPAPFLLRDDGSLLLAIPLFLGDGGWPEPPAEAQPLELRRGEQVVARSAQPIVVTELPRSPGTSREVQEAFADITEAYATIFSFLPVADEAQTPVRDGAVAMMRGLVSEGDNSLQAVLAGTAPLLEGAEVDTELLDALLASSGAADYLSAYAEALTGGQQEIVTQATGLYCDGEGDDFELACLMQIQVVLDDYSRQFVKPSVETYANTVGLASGLLAMATVSVPGAAIVGAILGVADFVMEKIAPALFPAKITRFELEMPDPAIEVGDTTVSRILVAAVNDPPQISYLDLFEQVKTLAGLKSIEFTDKFYEVLKATAEFALDLYLKIIKTYEKSHPGTYPWATAGDIRIPAMRWGPLEVTSDRLVKPFSADESVADTLEEQLEWRGLRLGTTTVRVMPRGPGDRSKVLRDHALCIGCVYSGGAFGHEMPESTVEVGVGDVELTATPERGTAPLQVTFAWSGLVAGDEPLTCVLDVGDGATFYTIHDCAVTTSQPHTYPYTSALDNAAGTFQATLSVVGSGRSAGVEVMADWSFTATPAAGDAPLEVDFVWDIPFPAAGGSVRCTLDPGDGSEPQDFDDCLAKTAARHTYERKGSFVATLTIANAVTADTKTAPVSVSGAEGCEGVMDVEAWRGTISYSHGRDVANEHDHIIYQVHVDVSGDLDTVRYRTDNVVGFSTDILTGSISLDIEEHAHGPDYHRVDSTFSGSGAPVAESWLSFNVFADCRYDFYVRSGVAGSGTFFGEPYSGQHDVNPLAGRFDGATLAITGSYAFPVYHPSDIDASDKEIWFAERGYVADIIGRDALGTVTVTWSFTPLE